MKNYFTLMLILTATLFAACKKNYSCSALDSNGKETIYNCDHCTSKDVDDYKQTILNDGYASVSCDKK